MGIKAIIKNSGLPAILLILLCLSFLYLAFTIFFSGGSISFAFSKNDDELAKRLDEDLERLLVYLDGIRPIMAELEKMKDIYSVKSPDEITKEQKGDLVQLWVSFLDHLIAMNKLVDDYKHFYKINYFKKKELHSKAFLIGYGAYITYYSNGVKFIDITIDNKIIEKILNDSYAEYGIPDGMYSKLKWNVLHVNDVIRLTAGYGNYKFLYEEFEKMGLTKKNKDLFDYIEASYEESTKKLKKEAIVWFPKNGLKIFKEKTYSIWFPIQKNVAKKMGKIRATRRHENFITEAQIKEMKKSMEPGDIILERRNWYTSNIGIPGFWPHAAFYLGTYDELIDYFNKPDVMEYLKMEGYSDIKELLKDTNETFYEKFSSGKSDVIEAVAPGVVLKPLAESAKADYVGVIRPAIDNLIKFKAIISAISHYGKPYDYHFNLISDSALFCSELVYKAYKSAIDLKPKRALGRFMVTGNDFIEKFDKEFDNGSREMDFVYFLDGSEDKKSAKVSGAEELRKTWQRPKWDIVQD